MGGWYLAGVAGGVALALGVLCVGLAARSRRVLVLAVPVVIVVAAALGMVLTDGFGAPCAVVGALSGVLAGSSLARGVHSRGGVAAGTAGVVALAAAGLAALSLVPLVGYLLVLAAPVFVWHRSRRHPERFAGLRTLAE